MTPSHLAALTMTAMGCAEPFDPSWEAAERSEPLRWSDEQRLEAYDAAEFDQFGHSVALEGDLALIGAYGRESYRGAVYTFTRGDSEWVRGETLIADAREEGASFGWSVSISGDRVLIGAAGEAAYAGAAYVFVRTGNAWHLEQRLEGDGRAEGDRFGWSVALDGDRALVGAFGTEGSRGKAYVFVRDQSTWSLERELVSSPGLEGDQFGYSVAMNGNDVLVGAPGFDTYRGAVHVFSRSAADWTEAQQLVASTGTIREHFGSSVSLAGERALIGSHWYDALRGAAYVFVRRNGSWAEEQKLVASDGSSGHRFAISTALGSDRALLGASGHDSASGAAYVFRRSVDDVWIEEQKLVASDGAPNDLLGWAVSLDAHRVLLGAYYDDNLRGAAYLYSLDLQSDGGATRAPEGGPSIELEEVTSSGSAGCECRAGARRVHGLHPGLGLVLVIGFGRRRWAALQREARVLRRNFLGSTHSERNCAEAARWSTLS